MVAQPGERDPGKRRVIVQPAMREFDDWHGVELNEASSPLLARRDEFGLFEHAQVFEDRVPAELRQYCFKLSDGLSVGRAQAVQQRAPVRIGKGPDGAFELAIVRHTIMIGDHLVTYQGVERQMAGEAVPSERARILTLVVA